MNAKKRIRSFCIFTFFPEEDKKLYKLDKKGQIEKIVTIQNDHIMNIDDNSIETSSTNIIEESSCSNSENNEKLEFLFDIDEATERTNPLSINYLLNNVDDQCGFRFPVLAPIDV